MNLKVLQAAAVLAAGALAGQTADRRGFRSNSDLVLVAATVLDRTDHPVRGLTRADFRLFDDKVEQTIASFGEQDAPLSLAMVFDTSGSMLDKLPIMRGSLAALLADSNPEDEFSLVRFADRAQTAVRWTPNADEIPSAVFSRPAHGRTALWDAVHLALEQFKQAHKRRHALVIFSDGGDNFSRFSQTQIARELAEADVQVYAIDTSELFAIRNQYVDEMPVANPLADMSDRAGGRYFQLASRQDAQKVAQQIGRELRSQYVLGYSPSRQSLDGKLHAIQLRVQRPEGSPRLSVFWRRGYRAPLF